MKGGHDALPGRDYQHRDAISAGNTEQQISIASDYPIRFRSLLPGPAVPVYSDNLVPVYLLDRAESQVFLRLLRALCRILLQAPREAMY